MKWVGLALLLCASLMAWWLYRIFGQQPDPPTEKDSFLYGVALEFHEPRFCDKIHPQAEGSEAGWGRSGYQITYLQSECYFNVAGELHDPSLCDKVRPVSRGSLDGSQFTPEHCRELRHYQSSGVVDPHGLAAWMRRLGYTKSDFYDVTYRNGLGSALYKTYIRLRDDNQLAPKVAEAADFDELLAPDKTRPANDLEYLRSVRHRCQRFKCLRQDFAECYVPGT